MEEWKVRAHSSPRFQLNNFYKYFVCVMFFSLKDSARFLGQTTSWVQIPLSLPLIIESFPVLVLISDHSKPKIA